MPGVSGITSVACSSLLVGQENVNTTSTVIAIYTSSKNRATLALINMMSLF